MGKFDEIFDDVVVNAKAAATAVSQKASSVYDASKHKFTAAEIRSEINKKLRDLGALTYKAQIHETDLSEQINTIIVEITDLKESLKVINDYIAAAQNRKKCVQCGANLPRNSAFCNICGAKLEEEQNVEDISDVD